MNDKIKEYMKQAGTDTSGKWMGVEHADKFAELIVEDTLKLLKQEWYDLNNIPLVEGENTRDVGIRVGRKSEIIVLLDKIRTHFGVEDNLISNILAGADQQDDDDKEYSLSTQEKYDEFVKNRNYPL